MLAIRGATSVDRDDAVHVAERVRELFGEILARNQIDRIVSATFSVTPDIRSANPATVVREHFGLADLALMCLQEAVFEGSAPGIVRVLLLCEARSRKFVYLHRAAALRADLA